MAYVVLIVFSPTQIKIWLPYHEFGSLLTPFLSKSNPLLRKVMQRPYYGL